MFKEKESLRAKAWESTVRKAQQQHRRRFFSPMSVAPADDDSSDPSTTPSAAPGDDDTDPDDYEELEPSSCDDDDFDEVSHERLHHAERLLPCGDYYNGNWLANVGHGVGKYLWTDGCMYEGEWRSGKFTGKGKFSWPSGASYEGEFKAGFMDGSGVYTGASGDTYRGLWSMNLRHGNGTKLFSNGDKYEGEWRSGLEEGQGRYLWRNGSEYVGQWRAGVMHGKGSLRWWNGNRYEGNWESGQPQGNGSFQWGDGSLYMGVWAREGGGVQVSGVYYPAPGAGSPAGRDPQEALGEDLKDCKVGNCEGMGVLPSQKKLNWGGAEDWGAPPLKGVSDPGFGYRQRRSASAEVNGGKLPPRRPNEGGFGVGSNEGGQRGGVYGMRNWESDGDFECDVLQGRSSSVDVREGFGQFGTGMQGRGPPVPLPPRKVGKKQGETICRGHKNYELMLNLQLGIRY